ncbi:hypothetical protein AAG570_003320 [Ranatra chinensis]|uniref:Uncharacterized protein n=1 Tax=Ranatra chinensis TaxID=642074 RepID=A0ABD0Y6I2_9HEMI
MESEDLIEENMPELSYGKGIVFNEDSARPDISTMLLGLDRPRTVSQEALGLRTGTKTFSMSEALIRSNRQSLVQNHTEDGTNMGTETSETSPSAMRFTSEKSSDPTK